MPFRFNPFTDRLDLTETPGGPSGFVESLTGNTGGTVYSDDTGNINVLGSGGVQVAGDPGTNTLTITVSTMGFTWNVVTSATNPNSLVAENGYIPKGASVVNFVLPATAAVGDTFLIVGYGNLWTLGQNANQSITLGVDNTTVGVGGSIAASQVRDSIELVCVTANLEFQIRNCIGNLIFV